MGEGGNFSYLRKIVHLSAPHRSEAIRYAHPAKGGLLWKLDYRASPPIRAYLWVTPPPYRR